jgi:hypothetical protein
MKYLKKLMYIVLSISSCAPIQGYTGAPQNTNQLSRVSINSKSGSASNDYELTPEEINIDGYSLPKLNSGINLLPGFHSAEFTWRYETGMNANDSSAIQPTWVKFGKCRINFRTEAGKNYTIEPGLGSSGTWITDPKVRVTVSENGKEIFMPRNRIIATANCDYSGRSIGSQLDFS